MGIPLAIFTLSGHQLFGLIASLGAFTVLYGTHFVLADRLRLLPAIAMGFVAASGLGVLSAANAWATVLCLVAVSALACIISFSFRLGPPGPMHFVLVTGISSHLAAPIELGGASIEPILIPALVAAGALSGYALIAAPLALPRMRGRDGPALSCYGLFPRLGLDLDGATIALRVVSAVIVAGLISLLLGIHHAYWLVMVAGAVLQVSPNPQASAVRAVHRTIGTVSGAAIFGLVELAEPRGLWLVAVLASLQCAIEIVVARHYALALTFITPLALTISVAGATDAPLTLATERIADTLLGAAVAMAVLWASSRIRPGPAKLL